MALQLCNMFAFTHNSQYPLVTVCSTFLNLRCWVQNVSMCLLTWIHLRPFYSKSSLCLTLIAMTANMYKPMLWHEGNSFNIAIEHSGHI